MRHRKRLYNIAKQSGKSEDWAAYRSARNSVNSQLECAHNAYYGRLFNDSFAGNRRQLWKYIQARHKEPSGVSTLLIDNQSVSDPKGKVITLSNQFQSFFTREDLSNVPILEASTCIQAISSISFNVNGIQNLLSNLDLIKPMVLMEHILKSCSIEIAPILEVIFKQSLNTGELPSD